MTPISLRQTGEYDSDAEITVDAAGRFSVELGGYVTAGRRTGTLTRRQQRTLTRRTDAVDLGASHPAESGIQSVLRVGDAEVRWGGPPPTPALAALAGALVAL